MEKEGRFSQQRNIRQFCFGAARKTWGFRGFDLPALCVSEAAGQSSRNSLYSRGELVGGQRCAQVDSGIWRRIPSRPPGRQNSSLDRYHSRSGFLHGIARGGGWTDGDRRVLPQARSRERSSGCSRFRWKTMNVPDATAGRARYCKATPKRYEDISKCCAGTIPNWLAPTAMWLRARWRFFTRTIPHSRFWIVNSLLILVVLGALLKPSQAQTDERRDTCLVNINKVTVEELEKVPGIGRARAEMIVRMRQKTDRSGRWRSCERCPACLRRRSRL